MKLMAVCQHLPDKTPEEMDELNSQFFSPAHDGRFFIVQELCQDCFTQALLETKWSPHHLDVYAPQFKEEERNGLREDLRRWKAQQGQDNRGAGSDSGEGAAGVRSEAGAKGQPQET